MVRDHLTRDVYTADAAYVFEGKIYVYVSHDADTVCPKMTLVHTDMMDYHVLHFEIDGKAVDWKSLILRMLMG